MLNLLVGDHLQVQKIVTIAKVWGELRQLRAHDKWERGQINAYQSQNLASLREFAYANSPFYQQFHRGYEKAPLAELPVLTKSVLMDNFEQVVTDPRIKLEQAR